MTHLPPPCDSTLDESDARAADVAIAAPRGDEDAPGTVRCDQGCEEPVASLAELELAELLQSIPASKWGPQPDLVRLMCCSWSSKGYGCQSLSLSALYLSLTPPLSPFPSRSPRPSPSPSPW